MNIWCLSLGNLIAAQSSFGHMRNWIERSGVPTDVASEAGLLLWAGLYDLSATMIS